MSQRSHRDGLPDTDVSAGWRRHLRAADDRKVAVGQLALARSGPPLLASRVGTGVAVCAWAEDVGVAGMVHVAFPMAQIHPALATTQPYLFADTGVDALVRALVDAGAARGGIRVDLVGGGELLGGHPGLDVGARVFRAAEAQVVRNRVTIRTRLAGGAHGRVVALDPRGALSVDGRRVEAA